MRKKQKPDSKGKLPYSEKTAALLPEKISGIKVQKKNKSRFSLFVEEEFLMGVSDHVLTKFNLYKGVEITPFLLDKLVREEEKWAAREYLFRILSRRDHSGQELKTKALKKGYPASCLDELIEELKDKGYVDDFTFARKYAADKYEFNNWGPFKIQSQLYSKGISREMAARALDEVFGDEHTAGTLKELVEKRKRRFRREPEEKRKKKIFAYLMRKGYDSETIWKTMDELIALVDQ